MEQINYNNFQKLIDEEDVKARINDIALLIDKEYNGRDVVLICVLNGAVVFTTNLMMQLKTPAKIDFMKVSSYDGINSSGVLNVILDLRQDINGKDVIICEDIVDTGYTLSYLRSYLLSKNPSTLKIAVLLDKSERRKVDVPIDYVGFTIPDKFVIGYGLDYNQVGRNIPYIGYVVDPKKEIITLRRDRRY